MKKMIRSYSGLLFIQIRAETFVEKKAVESIEEGTISGGKGITLRTTSGATYSVVDKFAKSVLAELSFNEKVERKKKA